MRQTPPPTSVLRDARKRQGLTLRELSRRSGVSHPLISQAERFERGLSLDTLARLAPYLGLSPADVVQVINEMREHRHAA